MATTCFFYYIYFYTQDQFGFGQLQNFKHAGIHEAVIGAGNCCGPAIAAAALLFFPAHPSSGTLAVCLLLMCGLGGLFWLRYKAGATAS